MSTSLRGVAALPHRRNNLLVALPESTIYRSVALFSRVQGWAHFLFRKGGPLMARAVMASAMMALPRFLEKTDFQRMHVQRVWSAPLFAGAMLFAVASAFPAIGAEYRGTQDQQQACTPDVMRLCADSVPDVSRIVVCLRRNRSNLSAPCGAVFSAGGAHRPKKG
jgi:hypothetical protein